MQLKNKPYRIVPLARIIAYKLYVAHINDDSRDRYQISDIAELFSVSISKNLIRSAMDILRNDRLVARSGNNMERPHQYRILSEGILMVEKALRNKSSDIFYFHLHGDESLDDIAGNDAIFIMDEERVDTDAWRPLQIDRDSPEYIEVVQAVDDALEKIRGDNGYATEFPEERSGILTSVEDGLDWLKNKMPTKAQLISKIVDPLRYVAAKFSGVIIGESAKYAVRQIMHWLAGL